MGIGRALIDAAAAVPFEKIRALSRDEIVRFGIDPRGFAESRWVREENKSGQVGLLKFSVEAGAAEPRQTRMSLTRLSCSPSSQIVIQFARERSPGERFKAVSILTSGNEIVLTTRGQPMLGSNGLERELRAASTTRKAFEDAVKGGSIEIVTTREGATADAESRIKLSTAGLVSQLSALGAPCF